MKNNIFYFLINNFILFIVYSVHIDRINIFICYIFISLTILLLISYVSSKKFIEDVVNNDETILKITLEGIDLGQDLFVKEMLKNPLKLNGNYLVSLGRKEEILNLIKNDEVKKQIQEEGLLE